MENEAIANCTLMRINSQSTCHAIKMQPCTNYGKRKCVNSVLAFVKGSVLQYVNVDLETPDDVSNEVSLKNTKYAFGQQALF